MLIGVRNLEFADIHERGAPNSHDSPTESFPGKRTSARDWGTYNALPPIGACRGGGGAGIMSKEGHTVVSALMGPYEPDADCAARNREILIKAALKDSIFIQNVNVALGINIINDPNAAKTIYNASAAVEASGAELQAQNKLIEALRDYANRVTTPLLVNDASLKDLIRAGYIMAGTMSFTTGDHSDVFVNDIADIADRIADANAKS